MFTKPEIKVFSLISESIANIEDLGSSKDVSDEE